MVFLAFVLSGCARRQSPERLYESIRGELQNGQLDRASADAQTAHAKFLRKDEYWAWKFLVLKAHILMYQGHFVDSLNLLAPDLPESLARTDVAVRRNRARVNPGGAIDRAQHCQSTRAR